MSEEETKTKEKNAKISKLAVTSLVLMMPAAIASIIFTSRSFHIADVPIFFGYLYFTIILAGYIIALTSLFQIITSKGRLKGILFAGLSIAILLFSLEWIPSMSTGLVSTRVPMCRYNLEKLRIALENYSYDYQGNYPTAYKWCDLLKDYHVEKYLVCPAQRGTGERCHYAINPYCEPNSPPDTVLLFETKGGWNQFGGIEMANTDNHPHDRDRFWGYKIRGCSILFNDGSVRSVREEEFTNLKWKPDEEQKE